MLLSNVSGECGIKTGYAKCTRRARNDFLGHHEYGAGGPWLPRAVANVIPGSKPGVLGTVGILSQVECSEGVTDGRELSMHPKELSLKGRCDGLSPL